MDISVKDGSTGSRARKSNTTKRELAKDKRYMNTTQNLKTFVSPCNHVGKIYECNKVTLGDVKKLRERYYETASKIDQDIKLCHMISVVASKRKRSVKETPKPRPISCTYYSKTGRKPHPVRVCLNFFVAALGITKRRVSRVAKVIEKDQVPQESRGGDRISNNQKPNR